MQTIQIKDKTFTVSIITVYFAAGETSSIRNKP